jgi:hypothetical protein
MTRRAIAAFVVVLIVFGAAAAFAQRSGVFGGLGGSNARILPNISYDGRFTFIRLRYGPPIAFQSQRVPWSHDYPEGEEHMTKILTEISYLDAHTDQSNVMAFDDPNIFKYPTAYLSEPGEWFITEHEAQVFRQYLQKGGFFIVDDFRYRDWPNFEEQMRRILPDARYYDLDESNPIFHSFFEIKDLNKIPNYYDPGHPIFRGIYENNDPTKRLMVMINYNTDVSEFWEWSDTGFKPIDESNEAYKLGVNYFMYGMTH